MAFNAGSTTKDLDDAKGILAKPRLPYENPILNPNYVKIDDPGFKSQGIVSYMDPHGRIGLNEGNRETGQVARAPSFMDKAVPRNTPAIPPAPPPGGNTTPEDTINKGEEVKPEVGTPQQNLFQMGTLGTLLGVGTIANGIYSMATNNLVNTGLLSGAANAVDAFAYNAMPGVWADSGAAGVGGIPGQTTLTNALGYGMFGGFAAGLLGLSSGDWIKDTVAGAVGGAAGGATAGAATSTAVGQALGSWAGPIGAFLGGFAATALVSAFGPRPSDNLAGGLYSFGDSKVTNTWTFHGKKYSTKNNNARDVFFGYVGTLNEQLTNEFGGKTTLQNVRLDLGRHTGVAVGFNSGLGDEDTGRDVGGGKEALELVGKEILRTSEYTNGDIAYVQSTLDWNTADFGTISSAYAFAKDFRRISSTFISGELNIDTDFNESMQIVDTWESRAQNLFKDDPDRLALTTQAANQARIKINSTRRA